MGDTSSLQVLQTGELRAVAERCNIAVVPSMGLGDGCVYLVLAANLARAGYTVTVYSNQLAPLADWLPAFDVVPLPMPAETFAVLDGFDLVISDLGSMVTRHEVPASDLAERYMFVGTCKVNPQLVRNPAAAALARLTPDKHVLLSRLVAGAGSLRCVDDDRISMVDQAVRFCSERLGLSNATKDVGLLAPVHLKFRRYSKRVMIHPLSYNPKKNWPREKYMSLARRLEAKGLEPQFVLSPKERAEHGQHFMSGFDAPVFPDTSALAEHLFESGYVIGNDSGVGHLASLLGVPVLTLYRKRRDGFCWRPDWAPGAVVRPAMTLGIIRNAWPLFMSVSRVERAFLDFQKAGEEA